MATLFIRTGKGEYIGGETVYGAVYLEVSGPTSGTGVKLKIFGYENYIYQEERSQKHDQGMKDYFECRGIDLYKSDVGVSLGCYVFPFQYHLPARLPGSFQYEISDTMCKWEANVQYTVKVELIGAEDVKEEQTLVIREEHARQNGIASLSAKHEIKGFLRNGVLTILAKLDKLVYTHRESAKLDVDIEMERCKVHVSKLTIELMRDLKLIHSKTLSSERNLELHGYKNSSFEFSVDHPQVVKRIELNDGGKDFLKKGLKNIIVPLHADEPGTRFYPTSCTGKYIKCKYWILITVETEGGQKYDLNVPIVSISQADNTDWAVCSIPPWCYNCKQISNQHECVVPKNVLGSEVFSGLPGFQVLNI